MKHMNSLRSSILLAALVIAGMSASAQIAINTTPTAPNTKAILDLVDPARGLLLPRMTRAERVAIVAPAPANSLLVYQTDDFTPAPPALPEPKGLWYRDGASWVRVGTSPAAWQLGGNAGTNPATNFLGTTDAVDLSIRTNGVERIRVLGAAGPAQGFVGINQAAPNERLEVSGAMRVNGTTATANAGDIRLNPTTNAHEGYSDNAQPYPASGWYQLENVFGTRLREGYIAQGAVVCTYPTGAPTGPNSNVTQLPSPWPIIDNTAYPNVASFGTLETPYSRFWEDGRHQFLYEDDDFLALNICPNTNINGIAFQAQGGSSGGFNYQHVRMKNTLSGSMTTLDLVGLQNCLANVVPNPQTIVTGWNIHNFTSPFQWTGVGANVLVEYSFDNQDWTGNVSVQSETTPYLSNYSMYCDACGHINGNPNQTCYWTNPPGCGPPPGGTYPPATQTATPGVLCTGWGHTGGPFLTTTSGTITCDGTFTFSAAQGSFFKRPLLALYAQNTGTVNPVVPGNYLVAQQGMMIGSNAWSTAGAFPNQNFQGPGTISAQKAVFANNVFLSDHVFDQYFAGAVTPEDAAMGKQYAHVPVREMANYVERERHLPTIDGRALWNANGAFSVDHVTNQMWVTVEAQALYIKELNERTEALQKYLVEKRLKQLGKN
jgi:hypothetical protein